MTQRPLHPLEALPCLTLRAQTPVCVPSTAACHALWDKYAMLDHIRAHSTQVADLAVALAERARDKGHSVDVPSVRASALLHDIAKTYTIAHGGSHAQMGASWVVTETGNRDIARGVMTHVHWPWPVDDATNVCRLPFFIIYADKRIKHATCVSLAERFEDLLARYGHTDFARASIRDSYAQGQAIERALNAQLDMDLAAHTLEGGRLVPQA